MYQMTYLFIPVIHETTVMVPEGMTIDRRSWSRSDACDVDDPSRVGKEAKPGANLDNVVQGKHVADRIGVHELLPLTEVEGEETTAESVLVPLGQVAHQEAIIVADVVHCCEKSC